tara:strand:+ start:37 stop:693 length:657 start_codon:yes stop_codon:yes gene_type:complete
MKMSSSEYLCYEEFLDGEKEYRENSKKRYENKLKWYKDNPETKKAYDKTRVRVTCSDGIIRRVSPTHPDYPHYNPNNFKISKTVDPLIQKLRDEDKKLYEISDNKQSLLIAGFVYVISHPKFSPWLKVGHSRDPERRLSGYNTGCPNREFKLEGYLYFENRKIAERNIHSLLEDQGFLKKGEWFNCSTKYVLDMLEKVDDQVEATKLIGYGVDNEEKI